MHVAGGFYLEHCVEPHWYQFYGSGGRAAAALARRDSLTLSTYASDADAPMLEQLASTYGFDVHVNNRPETIQFRYQHGLARPNILPSPNAISEQSELVVSNEYVLRFGYLEGNARVTGEYVVYDPQSAFDPRPFAENGSSAKHLAVVCNSNEARRMTGLEDLEDGARRLMEVGAEVVVIKMGSNGALVKHDGHLAHIPAFKTQRIWPLGSGDVFAAVFAFEWGKEKQSPEEAAKIASQSTAHYCDTQALPVPSATDLPDFVPIQKIEHKHKPKVYLAGPFFTTAQRWMISEIRQHLSDQHVDVFSPFHDVGLGIAADVVPQDIDAIKSSDSMLAVLDGLDSGTIFEVGYARALNIPVVGFVQSESAESMKMLDGTDCILCNDMVSAIYRTVWEASHE